VELVGRTALLLGSELPAPSPRYGSTTETSIASSNPSSDRASSVRGPTGRRTRRTGGTGPPRVGIGRPARRRCDPARRCRRSSSERSSRRAGTSRPRRSPRTCRSATRRRRAGSYRSHGREPHNVAGDVRVTGCVDDADGNIAASRRVYETDATTDMQSWPHRRWIAFRDRDEVFFVSIDTAWRTDASRREPLLREPRSRCDPQRRPAG